VKRGHGAEVDAAGAQDAGLAVRAKTRKIAQECARKRSRSRARCAVREV